MQKRQGGYGHNRPIQTTPTAPSASTGGVLVWLLTNARHVAPGHQGAFAQRAEVARFVPRNGGRLRASVFSSSAANPLEEGAIPRTRPAS